PDPLYAALRLRGRVGQRPENEQPGRERLVALIRLGRHDGTELVDRQLAAVRVEHGDGRQLPDPVLLAEGYRRKCLQLRSGIHGVERVSQLLAVSGQPGESVLRQPYVPTGPGSDGRTQQPPVWRRREHAILERP